MMKQNSVIIWLCVALAILGLAGKGIAPNKAPEGAGQAALNSFEVAANRAGLRHSGGWNLTMEGTYWTTIFIRPDCDGALLTVPLPRNAEGADLLKRALRTPPQNLFFLLEGKRHAAFPDTAFWLSGLRHDVLRLAGISNAPPPVVLAVAEDGLCNLASRIDWSTVAAGTGLARHPST